MASDAGPLIYLAQINKLHLIKKLFNRVIIIPEVKKEAFDEGVRLGHADAQAIRRAIEEGWITIKAVPETLTSAAKKLAEGENIFKTDAKTLILARRLQIEIIVDEKALSDLAKMFGLKVWNTWTILLESLRKGQAQEILEAARLIVSKRKEKQTKA